MCQQYEEICIAGIDSLTCLILARQILREKEKIWKIKKINILIQKKIIVLFQGEESNKFLFCFVKIDFERDLYGNALQLLLVNETPSPCLLVWIGGCMLVAQSQLKIYGVLNNKGQTNQEQEFRAYI